MMPNRCMLRLFWYDPVARQNSYNVAPQTHFSLSLGSMDFVSNQVQTFPTGFCRWERVDEQ